MPQELRIFKWNRGKSGGETHLPVLRFCRGISNNPRNGADAPWKRFVLGVFRMLRGCCLEAPLAYESYRKVPVRVQFGAIRLRVQALLLALFTSAMANGQAVPQQQGNKDSSRAATPVVRTGTAIYRGQELHYEVIDGWAVHGGDMVLGTVEEVLEERRRLRSAKASPGSWPARRELAPVEDEHLWPDGIIPYVIEPGFTAIGLKKIDEAIREWNSKTVITLVERTTEQDYVRFLPKAYRPFEPYCRASLGRKGGEQSIWLREPDGCSVSSTIHEIGHVVGLRHEHQRHDRDDYVTVSDAQSFGDIGSAYRADAPGRGPYDYSSIMHYGSVETVPPGIPLRSERLSSGDIDGVARLYGTVPMATTIATNPPGLSILVDGQGYTTPVRFNWRPGTTHTLEAVSPQTAGAKRLVFGRWNDKGSARRTISADADSTWYEANYISQHRMLVCVDPSEAGSVTVRPKSPDGFYVTGPHPVEVEARAVGPRRFSHWAPVPGLRRSSDRSIRGFSPGTSSNPAKGAIRPRSWDRARISESAAIYTNRPTFLVDSNIEGISILVGGESRKLPWAFPVDAYPNGVNVEAPETVPEQAEFADIRYRFENWSDGGNRAHDIRVPTGGGRLRLEVTPEYRLRVRSRNGSGDTAVEISPPSEDGFYPVGTHVQVTASPGQGRSFVGWIGELWGFESSQTVVMDSAKWLEAVFTNGESLRAGETKSVTPRSASQFRLYSGSSGYSVLVPRDASEMTVRFQSASSSEVDLYVQQGREPWWEAGESEKTRRIRANFASVTPGPMETIKINGASVPPLANDVYFVALAVPPTRAQIEGTLSVEIRRSGILKARPRAVTVVSILGSDTAPQTVRLTHKTSAITRYKIESNASWLMASPQEWVSSGSGVQEVSVVTNTAGLSLDTHRASLSVLKASSSQGDTTWAETGVEIPVTFAVVPSNPTSATSRRANAVVIEGGPQEGDTYGAGEQIRIAVNFTDPVEVTGLPILDLRVGNRTRQVTWAGRGSTSVCEGGYKSLEFGYLVQAEDLDNDGIAIGTNGLTLEWRHNPICERCRLDSRTWRTFD